MLEKSERSLSEQLDMMTKKVTESEEETETLIQRNDILVQDIKREFQIQVQELDGAN